MRDLLLLCDTMIGATDDQIFYSKSTSTAGSGPCSTRLTKRTSAIRKFTGEFHGFEFFRYSMWRRRLTRVVNKVARQFALVHVHANNFASLSSTALCCRTSWR